MCALHGSTVQVLSLLSVSEWAWRVFYAAITFQVLPQKLTNKALCNPVRNVMHRKEFREFEFGQHKRGM